MRTYDVSGTIKKIDGFGWLSFLVKNAKYTGTLCLTGKKSSFDKYNGMILYTATLKSVSGFWGISMTNLVTSKLGSKKVSGEIFMSSSPINGSGTGYNFSAYVSQDWKEITGKVNLENNGIKFSSDDIVATLNSDDGQYVAEEVDAVTTSTTTPIINTNGDLVDPNPSKYTVAYVSSHANYEECGIEAERKITVRLCCWRPSVKDWWMLSSLDEGRIKVKDGQISCPDFIKDGYSYHVNGWGVDEPHRGTPTSFVKWPGNSTSYGGRRYLYIECRKV